jgi:predicted dehydrogenase
MQKINLGVVGYGGIAKIHAIGLYAMKTMFEDMEYSPELYAAVSSKKDLGFPGFEYVTSDLQRLLDDPKVHALDVCTPNFLHYEQGTRVLASKKPLYMEKPVAKDIHHAKELAEIAEASQIVNQSALMYRFLPAIAMAKDLISSGKIGDIIHFRFALYHKGYLDSQRPMSWRLSQDKAGGGALVDLGIHMADSVRFLLGEPQKLMAQTDIYYKERYADSSRTSKVPSEVDEWALLNLVMESGAKGTLEVSRITSDLKEDTIIEIFGSKGSIKIHSDDVDFPTVYLQDTGLMERGAVRAEGDFAKYHKTIYPSHKFDLGWMVNAHLASMKNFLNNVNAGKILHPETPTLKEAYLSQRIIALAYESVENDNSWISFDN